MVRCTIQWRAQKISPTSENNALNEWVNERDTTKSNAKMMKIIHNLLFSIYFWANSLHTMHTVHTHSQRPPINAEIRTRSQSVFGGLPKGFHCCHPAYQQKAMRREQSCSFTIERTDKSTWKKREKRREKMKKAAAVAAKWNFHFTFIYFSMRMFFRWVCVRRVLFLVSRFALSSSSWRDTLKCWCWFDYSLSILQQTEWFISIFFPQASSLLEHEIFFQKC